MNANTDFKPADAAVRDLYYAVHKGLRLANARMLIALGQSDPADPQEVEAVLGRLAQHLDTCLAHLKHENAKIHAVVDVRVPGASDHADEDHEHHLASFIELRQLAEAVAVADDAGRPGALRRLYQRFALFTAEDFQHMHEEETRLMPLIARHFSSDEVDAIEHAIVSSIAPEVMIPFMRFMLGAATRSERIATVTEMKAGMPPEVFGQTFAAIVHPQWRHDDWDEMERVLC
jgi:hypothetical protein